VQREIAPKGEIDHLLQENRYSYKKGRRDRIVGERGEGEGEGGQTLFLPVKKPRL